MPALRALLHLVLVSGFVPGVISVALRPSKTLGLTAVGATLLAALLGGSRVPIDGELQHGPFLGLDWFLLNLMAYSAVFIPLERRFALRRDQRVLRKGCGAFTRSTTRPRSSTGWPARACTSSTSWSRAA